METEPQTPPEYKIISNPNNEKLKRGGGYLKLDPHGYKQIDDLQPLNDWLLRPNLNRVQYMVQVENCLFFFPATISHSIFVAEELPEIASRTNVLMDEGFISGLLTIRKLPNLQIERSMTIDVAGTQQSLNLLKEKFGDNIKIKDSNTKIIWRGNHFSSSLTPTSSS